MAALPANGDELTERGQWFKSLTVPGGINKNGLCCDLADGHKVEAEQRGSTWYAKWEGRWVPVPPEIVLKTVSIDEHAYLFVYPVGSQTYRCFVPPLRGV